MNEQQLADLFSEQIDRILQGEAPAPAAGGDELHALVELGQRMSQTQFQASPAAQAAFQSQLVSWFGLANGGLPMTILGLSKTWFIGIIISIIAVAGGIGLIALVAISIFMAGPISQLPPSPTITATATEEATSTPVQTATGQLVATPTITPSATPDEPSSGELPALIFQSYLYSLSLCQGTYASQIVLVNYGTQPVTGSGLIWEVIEGAELVGEVAIDSPNLARPGQASSGDERDVAPASPADTSLASVLDGSSPGNSDDANFDPIAVGQEVKLDLKVKVKDNWWKNKQGTRIKVKLSVKNQGHSDHSSSSTVITIIKQDARWVTLTGYARPYGEQTLLIDGNIVLLNDCTDLPPSLPPNAPVEVTGLLQPDGTFIAINIILIDIDLGIVDFDSGVPESGDGEGDNHGGSRGGSKGGS